MTTPERAELSLGQIFGQLDRPAQQAALLLNLENALGELPVTVRLLAGLEPLLTRVALGWLSQSPSVEQYGCSHNAVMAWAQVFLPRVSEKGALADACFQCLALHCLPPTHGCLQGLCPGLARSLTAAAAPTALVLLERGLADLVGLDLKPYLRKRNRLDPGSRPGLQLGFHALKAFQAHPEWQVTRPDCSLLEELCS